MIEREQLIEAHRTARGDLLAERTPAGHWVGGLSSSALATATALSGLAVVDRHAGNEHPGREPVRRLIARAVDWLARCPNDDGGWGDTDKSRSNIATTMLVRAAFHLAGVAGEHEGLLGRAEQYIHAGGDLAGLRRRYGKDKTFAVPILANCALARLVPWSEVPPLPFELALLPNRMLRFLRMPVVSYALPALVAIGQARYRHRRPRNPFVWLTRRLAVPGSLRALGRMQPESGGFLEATPLTGFVVMSLASINRVDDPVVRRGVEFLIRSVRPDGSWPVNADLATWNTTLSINALAAGGHVEGFECVDWLWGCQHRHVHPMTEAAPGGWGWTDLSGAVPDVDDTAGALLALSELCRTGSRLQSKRKQIHSAATAGVGWLLDVQNADGGWPTFCRGWGNLPFDRSATDLTAHAVRALCAWRASLPALNDPADRAVARGLDYLTRQQRPDGSWVPLWFGNQHHWCEENPVYGTARVLLAYRDLGRLADEPARRGLNYLAGCRNADGGWGGDGREASSVEETAVATEALLADPSPPLQAAAGEGLGWLVRAVRSGRHHESSPIGFYFAKLWYHERLYPLIFTVSALGRAVGR